MSALVNVCFVKEQWTWEQSLGQVDNINRYRVAVSYQNNTIWFPNPYLNVCQTYSYEYVLVLKRHDGTLENSILQSRLK